MSTTDGLPAALALARRHTIGDLLSKSAARFPDRIAIIWRGSRETYAEFDRTVNRTANSLSRRDRYGFSSGRGTTASRWP